MADSLKGKRICICCGSGGVGKTTTSAALALGMAARGARVAVVTIDPAQRLASALGLEELDNEPRLVTPAALGTRAEAMPGELWAMMLDPKRTFDDLIGRLAPDERTRDEVLGNRIYRELSGAVAGSQEFTAISKLYELDQDGGFDLIVLDTPPSRNALDFLDAPDRLANFFEGRAVQLFLKPAGFGMKIVGRGSGLVFSILGRATGVDLLKDVSVFFQSMSGLIDGIKERADHVGALLADPGTVFLLVTSPEREPIDEAIYFWRRLRSARMPFGGVIVNRVHHALRGTGAAATLPDRLAQTLGDAELADKVAESAADYRALADRDTANVKRLSEQLGAKPLVLVPHFDDDVHDSEGLARMGDFLFASAREREKLITAL